MVKPIFFPLSEGVYRRLIAMKSQLSKLKDLLKNDEVENQGNDLIKTRGP